MSHHAPTNQLRFPTHLIQREPEFGASRAQRIRAAIALAAGRLAREFGVPGAIRTVDIDDPLTGDTIQVRVGVLSTRIVVNGREHCFNRLTGGYTGSGMSCSC